MGKLRLCKTPGITVMPYVTRPLGLTFSLANHSGLPDKAKVGGSTGFQGPIVPAGWTIPASSIAQPWILVTFKLWGIDLAALRS